MLVPDNLRALDIVDMVVIDSEYRSSRGEPVQPEVACAKSLVTGLEIVHRGEPGLCPFPVGPDILYVTYAGHAEWSYFLSLNWPLPPTSIDLFAEESLRLNGRPDRQGRRQSPSLLDTLNSYNLDAISFARKEEMRALILRGNPSEQERREIIAYCWSDVRALEQLFPVMLPNLDVVGALLRGSYSRVIAAVEHHGIPVDVPTYMDLKLKWPAVKAGLVTELERTGGYRVYKFVKGQPMFSLEKFEALLDELGALPLWPRTPQSHLQVDDDTFRRMAQRIPYLEPLRVTRNTLTLLKKFDLPVGSDGRLRFYSRPWSSVTGRNQPSTKNGYIFGLPKWTRRLIKPAEKRALAYVDLKAAEFGIQAALSGDKRMQAVYRSGEDPYLKLAQMAGAVPLTATRESYPRERTLYKVAQLAASYGQTHRGLSLTTGCTEEEALTVHKNMKRVYHRYYAWREEVSIRAQHTGRMTTPLGWSAPASCTSNPNLLLNFPIQGTGADVLRTASAQMFDERLQILALVHDAILLEADDSYIECAAAIAQECWRQASRAVLNGFELDSDVEIVRYPRGFEPEGTADFWNWLTELRRSVPEGEFDEQRTADSATVPVVREGDVFNLGRSEVALQNCSKAPRPRWKVFRDRFRLQSKEEEREDKK